MKSIEIGHIQVDSPFANAGGVIKSVEDVEKIAHTGVGWIEAGSFTLEPRAGNSPNGENVYHHENGETYNSLGMPNRGIDIVETEIPDMVKTAHSLGKQLIVNVAPVSEEPVAESVELVSRAYEAGADAVLLNAGCPNVVTPDGGRHEILSTNTMALRLVLAGLQAVAAKYKPIFIRTSPMDDFENVRRITHEIYGSGVVNAVFTPNTWPGYKPKDHNGEYVLNVPRNVGGLSGPATRSKALQQTIFTDQGLFMAASRSKTWHHTKIVASGGITTGDSLAVSMRSGGAVAGAATTFFYESGDWSHDVDRLLHDYLKANGS